MKNLIELSIAILIIILLFSCTNQKTVAPEVLEIKKSTKEEIVIEHSSINYDSLKFVLDSVHYYDQYFFEHGLKGKEKYTEEEQAIIKKVNARHIQNLEIVSEILDTYGWLGAKEVGPYASSALFIVIQHNDIQTQIKYLPLLKKAVVEGKAYSADVAMLEDRMALHQGKKQKYGTQTPPHPLTGKQIVWPIENPEIVDELRKQIGFPPMAESLDYTNIKWNLQDHKIGTKELIDKNLMGFYIGNH